MKNLFNMLIPSAWFLISHRMESFWVQTAIGAIHAISFVCDVISFPVYLILQKPWRRKQLARRLKVSVRQFDFDL